MFEVLNSIAIEKKVLGIPMLSCFGPNKDLVGRHFCEKNSQNQFLVDQIWKESQPKILPSHSIQWELVCLSIFCCLTYQYHHIIRLLGLKNSYKSWNLNLYTFLPPSCFLGTLTYTKAFCFPRCVFFFRSLPVGSRNIQKKRPGPSPSTAFA